MNLQEITSAMEDLSNWGLEGSNSLTKQFEFIDFKESIEFVNKIAEVSEKAEHHPDITIRNNFVVLSLTSDIGELTEKDFALAKDIDSITSPLNKV